MNQDVSVIGSAKIYLPTSFGRLWVQHVESEELEGLLVSSGQITPGVVPVRVQSSCVFAESLGASNCDCAIQLQRSLQIVASERGILVYLFDEGRGAGLEVKIKAIECVC